MENTFDKPKLITIAVDVQNDFCPGGTLAVSEGADIVSPVNDVMSYTRQTDGIVVATRDWHPATTPHFDKWPVHCVANTPGADFHPALDIQPTDIIISKGMGQTDGYSAFEGQTDGGATLEEVIELEARDRRVAVVIGGLATDYCVLNTVLDATKIQARNKNIQVFALSDAMRAVNIQPQDGNEALLQMKTAGAHVVTSDDILINTHYGEV